MRLQSDRTYSVSAAVCKSHIVSDTRHTASVVSLGLVCVYVSVCVFARFFLTDSLFVVVLVFAWKDFYPK